jgi:hypothetical protein
MHRYIHSTTEDKQTQTLFVKSISRFQIVQPINVKLSLVCPPSDFGKQVNDWLIACEWNVTNAHVNGMPQTRHQSGTITIKLAY